MYDLGRRSMFPKFDLTGVWTHHLQITDSTFHVKNTNIKEHV